MDVQQARFAQSWMWYEGTDSLSRLTSAHIAANTLISRTFRGTTLNYYKGGHIIMNSIVNEYESIWNRAHNLNLHIDYIRANYPDVFAAVQEHFSSMPEF